MFHSFVKELPVWSDEGKIFNVYKSQSHPSHSTAQKWLYYGEETEQSYWKFKNETQKILEFNFIRWNSVYLTLKRLEELEKPITSFLSKLQQEVYEKIEECERKLKNENSFVSL